MEIVKGDKLGEGARGVVYRGLNKATGEIVALKELRIAGWNADDVRAFVWELQLLQRSSHPNIVKLLGFSRTESVGYIVMEYLSGGSLQAILQEFNCISEPAVGAYSRQILEGLRYLHEHGIVHRDVKPLNAILDKNGVVKLVDFGTARQVGDITSMEFSGTPVYMAPEVVRGGPLTTASDIWGVGCTVLQLLTATRPWSELGNLQTLSLLYHIGQSRAHPQIPPGVGATALDFLKSCFTLDPCERPTALGLLEHPFVCSPDQAPPTPSMRCVTISNPTRCPSANPIFLKASRNTDTVTVDTLLTADQPARRRQASAQIPVAVPVHAPVAPQQLRASSEVLSSRPRSSNSSRPANTSGLPPPTVAWSCPIKPTNAQQSSKFPLLWRLWNN
eukprot:TRINITY_DN15276_c0_g1_i1.p1 TRINITY_DN15276_c0_g1~~TRINITY_DN15276_c0_g1_i1.p1  ORF type:complete len:390 (-),score=44.64 TRINITY_DN15276_c0_g1_i1:31-1200(-)